MGKEARYQVLFIAVLFFLGTASARPDSPFMESGQVQCDDPPPVKEGTQCRIVGGNRAEHAQFPFQVSLQVQGYHICGGSILDDRHVLTAAHCVITNAGRLRDPKYMKIGVGNIYLPAVVKHQVTDIWAHEDYRVIAGMPVHDIAIVRVKCCVKFSATVQPVDLWNGGPIQPPLRCNVSGWGTEFYGGATTIFLKYVTVPVITYARCLQSYARLPVYAICAGEENRGSCQGDSGGPLVCEGKQVGIVSFGVKCGLRKYPGVFTDITGYMRWSKQTLIASNDILIVSQATYMSPALTFIFFLSILALRYF